MRQRHAPAGDRRVLGDAEDVLHAHRRPSAARPCSRSSGCATSAGASVVELGAERPGQLGAQQHAEVEPLEVGAAGGAGEVRRQPLVEPGERVPGRRHRATASPSVSWRKRDPRPELLGRRGPGRAAEPGRPDPLDERGGRSRRPAAVACAPRRAAARRAGARPARRARRPPRPGGDPRPRRSSTAAMSVGVDRRAEADAGAGALAVEVGGDEERHGRQRVVVGDPRAGAGAQLELAGTAAGGEPVGEPGEQRRAGIVGVDVAEVEGDAGAPGDVGGAVAHAASAGRRRGARARSASPGRRTPSGRGRCRARRRARRPRTTGCPAGRRSSGPGGGGREARACAARAG